MELGNSLGSLMVPELLMYTTSMRLIYYDLGHGPCMKLAVDFIVETLPGMVKASLKSAVALTNAIFRSSIDDHIKADFVDFFPGGPMQISKLVNDEIMNTIVNPETGNVYVQIMCARTGIIMLVTLIDP